MPYKKGMSVKMNKKELKEKIKSYKQEYKRLPFFRRCINVIIKHMDYCFYKLLIYSQKYRYYKTEYKSEKRMKKLLLSIYYGRKFFKYCKLTDCEVYSELGKNVNIFQKGIIINHDAIIGDGVRFHGHNCIGNNGKDNKAPIIGKNVDIGVGSVIIGNVEIADNITIGANSVVTKSFYERRDNHSW